MDRYVEPRLEHEGMLVVRAERHEIGGRMHAAPDAERPEASVEGRAPDREVAELGVDSEAQDPDLDEIAEPTGADVPRAEVVVRASVERGERRVVRARRRLRPDAEA